MMPPGTIVRIVLSYISLSLSFYYEACICDSLGKSNYWGKRYGSRDRDKSEADANACLLGHRSLAALLSHSYL